MRIDKLLWYLRFASSRAWAHDWVLEGHIRLNGRRVEKPGTAVGVGDVLTLPLRSQVLVIKVECLPARRGPPAEARECYHALDEHSPNPIAGDKGTQTRLKVT